MARDSVNDITGKMNEMKRKRRNIKSTPQIPAYPVFALSFPKVHIFRFVMLKNSVRPSTTASTFMLTRGILSYESSFMMATRAR